MSTIYDVAAEAGVSTATVSRVLSGNPRVKDATRDRVLAAVSKLDFRPSLIGQALNRGAGKTILMIVPLLSTPVLSLCIRAVAEELRDTPYRLLMGYYDTKSNDILDPQRDLMESDLIRGILFLDTTGNIPRFSKPAVVISEQPFCSYPYCVISNDKKATSMLTEQLIRQGIRRFAYIGMSNQELQRETAYSLERFKGLAEALQEHGIPFDKRHYYECHYTSDRNEDHHIYTAAAEIAGRIAALPADDRPEAVICAADIIAFACMHVFRQAGLRIPDDIRVTGYDNGSLSLMAEPSLTSVQSPFLEFGTEASRLLIKLMEDPEKEHGGRRIVIDPEVYFRESTNG